MSIEISDTLQRIRVEVSHESFVKRSIKRELDGLLINVTDADLDSINAIRSRISKSSEHIVSVCEEVQRLSWELTEPTEEQLEIVNEIIVLGRSVTHKCDEITDSLKFLWSKGVVETEMARFKEVMSHWDEVMDDIEAAFFTLPANTEFMKSKDELESL